MVARNWQDRRRDIDAGNLATFVRVVTCRASRAILASVAFAALSGCGAGIARVDGNRPVLPREEGRNLGGRALASREPEPGPLLRAAETYLGAPYLLGGESAAGIDCSALVQQVFRRAYGVELPRKAAWQGAVGVPVFKFGLRPGDLVFFGPRLDSVEHVGIYVGQGRFLNATSTSGVKYSSLDEAFWLERYLFARRVPGLASAPVAAPAAMR